MIMNWAAFLAADMIEWFVVEDSPYLLIRRHYA